MQKYYINIWGFLDNGEQRSFTTLANYSTTNESIADVSAEEEKRVIEHMGSFGTTTIVASFGGHDTYDITVTADENERVDITSYLSPRF